MRIVCFNPLWALAGDFYPKAYHMLLKAHRIRRALQQRTYSKYKKPVLCKANAFFQSRKCGLKLFSAGKLPRLFLTVCVSVGLFSSCVMHHFRNTCLYGLNRWVPAVFTSPPRIYHWKTRSRNLKVPSGQIGPT
jgi:hypothetical protein